MVFVEYKARTVYAYEGEGVEDLCMSFLLSIMIKTNGFLAFKENVMLVVNPSKSGGDWWFGRFVGGGGNGKGGLFPKAYVEVVTICMSPFFSLLSSSYPHPHPY